MDNQKKENLKSLFTNARTRLIIIFTFFILIIGITIAVFKINLKTELPEQQTGKISSLPGNIQSIPGAINQTAQYAQLQAQQNVEQATKALQSGDSSIPTIIESHAFGEGVESITNQGSLGFTALSTQAKGGEQSPWYDLLKNSNCTIESMKNATSQGAGLSDLQQACGCSNLANVGYSFKDLSEVCPCTELHKLGNGASEFKKLGYDARRLKACGFSTCELHAAGFTALQLKDAGFSDGELKGAGFSEEEIAKAGGLPDGMTLVELRAAGCDVQKLKNLKTKGVTAAAIRRTTGCSSMQLKMAGFTAKELLDAGFTAAELKAAAFSPEELKAAGFSARDLLNAGFSATDVSAAGFNEQEIAQAEAELPPGIILADLAKAGCDIESLKQERLAGVSATMIRKYVGCSANALKAAGFSDAELTRAGFSAVDIARASFNASQPSDLEQAKNEAMIKAAGCDSAQLAMLMQKGVNARMIKNINGCSATQLKAAGFNASNLTMAGFTPQELTNADFAASEIAAATKTVDAEIKSAGCNPAKLNELFNKGVSAEKIKSMNNCSAVQLKAAGFSAADLARAGFSEADLTQAGFSSSQPSGLSQKDEAMIKAAGCDPAQLAVLMQKGVNARMIKNINGCSATQLKAAGFNASNLTMAGFTPQELANAGFAASEIAAAAKTVDAEIKNAGCDQTKLKELFNKGVSAEKIKNMNNCSAVQLKVAGFSATDLAQAGFSAADIARAGFSPSQLSGLGQRDEAMIKAAGCDVIKLKKLMKQGVDLKKVRELNQCSIDQLKAAGAAIKDLLAAGWTPTDLLAAGFSAEDFKSAGLSPTALIAAGRGAVCNADSLRSAYKAGVSAKTIRETLGCSVTQLKAAGFSVQELKEAGYSPGELRNAGFSAQELKDANFSAKELKDAGFAAADLKLAGFNAKELMNAGFKINELKAAGFSAKELKNAGFTIVDLKAAGFSAKDMKDAGGTTAELKEAGYNASDMKAAGISDNELIAAGYSKEEIKRVGMSFPDSSVTGLDDEALTESKTTDTIPSITNPQSSKENNALLAARTTRRLDDLINRQQIEREAQQHRQEIMDRASAMQSAANTLLQTWKTVSTQTFAAGNDKEGKEGKEEKQISEGAAIPANEGQQSMSMNNSRVSLKAGDILFAVLDTTVNTDEPSPILATIVSGPLKGSKLIGNFTVPQNADKMVIMFNTISMPRASKTSGISAYAIDPETARTALSGRVDHHYMSRYGSMFASSFIEGFGNAFQSANTTVTIGGTGGGDNITVQNGIARSTLSNAVIGLSTVGKSWGQVAQQNVNRPTTIELYSGTSIGILLTQDITLMQG